MWECSADDVSIGALVIAEEDLWYVTLSSPVQSVQKNEIVSACSAVTSSKSVIGILISLFPAPIPSLSCLSRSLAHSHDESHALR